MIYQTIGLGSDQFVETDGDGNMWPLDRIIDENYDSTVLDGWPDALRVLGLPRMPLPPANPTSPGP